MTLPILIAIALLMISVPFIFLAIFTFIDLLNGDDIRQAIANINSIPAQYLSYMANKDK
jgi:hypothetical protein